MRHITVVALCAMFALLFAAPTYAGCPSDPLKALDGTWAFSLYGAGTAGPQAAIGHFKAYIAPDPRNPNFVKGYLKVVITSNNGGTVLPNYASEVGTYTIDSDCLGGTLTIPDGVLPGGRLLQFVFTKTAIFNTTIFGQMYLVNKDNNGSVLTGEASLLP